MVSHEIRQPYSLMLTNYRLACYIVSKIRHALCLCSNQEYIELVAKIPYHGANVIFKKSLCHNLWKMHEIKLKKVRQNRKLQSNFNINFNKSTCVQEGIRSSPGNMTLDFCLFSVLDNTFHYNTNTVVVLLPLGKLQKKNNSKYKYEGLRFQLKF